MSLLKCYVNIADRKRKSQALVLMVVSCVENIIIYSWRLEAHTEKQFGNGTIIRNHRNNVILAVFHESNFHQIPL